MVTVISTIFVLYLAKSSRYWAVAKTLWENGSTKMGYSIINVIHWIAAKIYHL